MYAAVPNEKSIKKWRNQYNRLPKIHEMAFLAVPPKIDDPITNIDEARTAAQTKTTAQIAVNRRFMSKLPSSANCMRCNRDDIVADIGGGYNGVVCYNHRLCMDCTFRTDWDYGERSLEAEHVRSLPMTPSDPNQKKRWEKKSIPQCLGCAMHRPFVPRPPTNPQPEEGAIVVISD